MADEGGDAVLLDRPPADEHAEIAGRFTRLVDDVDADPDPGLWSSPTPVDGWTARDVVAHLTGWFPGFLRAFGGVELPTGPSAVENPAEAWRVLDDGVQALLDDPASAERTVALPHTDPMPLPQAVVRFFTADVYMHTWDLARATGRDATLDPERCAILLAGSEPIEELMRSSGQYGPRVEVPDDAGPQDRLLGFIGRDPGWRPVGD